MSRRIPGTKDWWIETALILAGGFGLAWLLWSGAPETDPIPERTTRVIILDPQGPSNDLGRYIELGCISAADLRALVARESVEIICPDDVPLLRDLPPDERPFP